MTQSDLCRHGPEFTQSRRISKGVAPNSLPPAVTSFSSDERISAEGSSEAADQPGAGDMVDLGRARRPTVALGARGGCAAAGARGRRPASRASTHTLEHLPRRVTPACPRPPGGALAAPRLGPPGRSVVTARCAPARLTPDPDIADTPRGAPAPAPRVGGGAPPAASISTSASGRQMRARRLGEIIVEATCCFLILTSQLQWTRCFSASSGHARPMRHIITIHHCMCSAASITPAMPSAGTRSSRDQ